jgi:hypothetical protein
LLTGVTEVLDVVLVAVEVVVLDMESLTLHRKSKG